MKDLCVLTGGGFWLDRHKLPDQHTWHHAGHCWRAVSTRTVSIIHLRAKYADDARLQ